MGTLTVPQRLPAASPMVTLVLFPRTLNNDDDIRALVDVRKKLRADGNYDVITYDPNSAAVIRASSEAHHPEWLTDPMGNDPERLALTRALGASFAVVVARSDGRGKMDVRVDEAAPSSRVWSGYDEKADDAARFIQQQAGFALSHPLSGTPLSPIPALPPAARALKPIPAPVMPPSPAAPIAALPIPAPRPAPVPLASPVPGITPPAISVPAVSLPPAAPIVPVPEKEQPLPTPPAPVPNRSSAPTVIAAPPASLALPAPVATPSVQPAPKVPAAVVPSGQPSSGQTLIVPSPLPIPAPSQVVVVPESDASSLPAQRTGEDLVSVRGVLAQGDDALSAGNFVTAIADYRDAINGAPLAMTPRLKLAQAYLQSDRRDKALSEAQRALEISPSNPAVQQFLMQLDAETGSSDGAVTRYQALAAQKPQDPAAHLELADALWNNGALTQAESEYQTAQALAGANTPLAQQAAAHLARLYAAQSRYVDSLAALKQAGAGGYALALGIVQSRADTLRSMLDAGQESLDAGKTTHESFYKTATDAAAQAQALADFVVKVTPPSAFTVSHLHRVLATHLMAQQAAVLVNYVETSDAGYAQQSARLEKEALTEMLTAHAAEEKLGLWNTSRIEARN